MILFEWRTVFIILFGAILVGCSTSAEPTPLAQISSPSATANVLQPTSAPLVSPTPSIEPTPSPMAEPSATPTTAPTATAILQTAQPIPNAEPVLEWVQPTEQPANLISISGGVLYGFEVRDDYVYASLGATLTVIDMGQSQIGRELNRIMLPGKISSSALSNRFMFVTINDFISIIDLQDPIEISEVARIKGLGKGELYAGQNGDVFFEDSQSFWWELDVDQVLPASRHDPRQELKAAKRAALSEHMDYFLGHINALQPKMEELVGASGFSQPFESHAVGSDLFIGTHSGSEGGGGQIFKLDRSDPSNLQLTSFFRTFTPVKIDYENGRLFAGYTFETTSDLSVVSVENSERPEFETSLFIHSNAFKSIGDQLYVGARGLSRFDGSLDFELSGQASMTDGGPSSLTQMIFDQERELVYGLRGVRDPSGLVIYSVRDQQPPQVVSTLDIVGPFQITYVQNKLYGFRSNYSEENPELVIIDVENPVSPKVDSILPLDDRLIGIKGWSGPLGEPIIALLTARSGLKIWDTTDPAQPIELASLEYPESCKMAENDPKYQIAYARQMLFIERFLISPLGICGNYKIDVSLPSSAKVIEPFPYSGPLIYEDGNLFVGGTNLKIYQLNE